ncbi:type II toxin-antitoxin system HicB family antitoxin [uncultured Methanospirillum sp.]|uniref:type II toxin-antitoxin system HicB family antitoxin n=1 Tax=uncultured Methanospirillum sp. TaxID=262503 RepID=UPI0029C8F545|nr:type II toxin-antitoxin system HicB family antitoxin [uncultured Methanospirillum sp.]
MNLKVVIEEDTEDDGFIISCPALPGCHSEGETVEEALANIRDASSFGRSGYHGDRHQKREADDY